MACQNNRPVALFAGMVNRPGRLVRSYHERMPFLLLVGAAPNAIAYESKQFTSGEFFKAGIPASLLLMVVITAFVIFIWPVMGMEVTIATP